MSKEPAGMDKFHKDWPGPSANFGSLPLIPWSIKSWKSPLSSLCTFIQIIVTTQSIITTKEPNCNWIACKTTRPQQDSMKTIIRYCAQTTIQPNWQMTNLGKIWQQTNILVVHEAKIETIPEINLFCEQIFRNFMQHTLSKYPWSELRTSTLRAKLKPKLQLNDQIP